MDWILQTKEAAQGMTGFSKPILHFLVGFCLYVMALAVTGSKSWSLSVVVLIEAFNEASDYSNAINLFPPEVDMRIFWLDVWKDIACTVAVPLLLVLRRGRSSP